MTGVRRLPWMVAATAMLVATACGSTVQNRGGTLSQGQSGQAGGTAGAAGNNGLGGPAGPGAGGTGSAPTGALSGGSTGGAPVGGGAGGPGGTTTGSTSTGQAGTTSTGGGSTSGGGAAGQGPGVTATTIAVGLPYITNASAAGNALGVVAGGGDQRAQWNIIIKDLNTHQHGILGRKIVPVYHPTDATSSNSYDAQEQSACSDYHEDHKVIAVLDFSANGVLQACTEKAGAVEIDENLSYSSAQTFGRYPHYVEVGNVRLDRMARNWPSALTAQKYFTAWDTKTGKPGIAPVKVGVLYFDDAASTYALNNALKPALAAAGQKNPDVQQIQSPKSTQDSGATVSAIQAAVLKFRSDGVTHVMPLDIGAGLALYFALNADNQKYYPRYGLTTSNGVQVLIDQAGFPKSQLNGAVGYGWVPLIDLNASRDPNNGPFSNDARRACLKLMQDGGQTLSTAVQQRSAVQACDKMRFLKSALEAGGPSVTQSSFANGVARLGGSFPAGNTFATVFGSRQHDGAATSRLFAYDGGCGCFGYTSGLRPIS